MSSLLSYMRIERFFTSKLWSYQCFFEWQPFFQIFPNDNHFSEFIEFFFLQIDSCFYMAWNRIEIALTRWQKLFELVCNRMFALQPVVPNLTEKKKNNKKNTFFCLLLVYSYSKNSVATNCDFFLTNLKYILFYKKIWFDFTKKRWKWIFYSKGTEMKKERTFHTNLLTF